jgi:hypothetical protein
VHKNKTSIKYEIPAGFCQQNTLTHQIQDLHLSKEPTSSTVLLDPQNIISQPEGCLQSTNNTTSPDSFDSLANDSSNVSAPILRCIDKPSSSLPSHITFTQDFIRASVGFRRIDHSLYKDTILLDTLPPDAILDQCDFANVQKSVRNTTPVPRPSQFGEVMHMDIVFGPDISLGNIHYGLLITDRFSRMTYLYPLQNLTSDIKKQLESFFAHLGMLPKRLITDFDTKLIGGKARDYLNSLKIHVNAATPNRQD